MIVRRIEVDCQAVSGLQAIATRRSNALARLVAVTFIFPKWDHFRDAATVADEEPLQRLEKWAAA